MNNYADRLIERIKALGSPVVAGLDPDYDKLPESIKSKYTSAGAALFAFNKALIDALYDVVPAVKPQMAYYERYGVSGLVALQATVSYAREKGMIVICDGKRNDIGSTSEAYAKAFLEPVAAANPQKAGASDAIPIREGGFDADALTVNPYLGEDGIKPFVNMCSTHGKGIYTLVKTSNPSSSQLQDLRAEDGRRFYEIVARYVDEWGKACIGKYGYSSVGAVVGATYPEEAASLRSIMKHTLFLVPGYGAQGGDAASVAVNFNEDGLGAIVNASRSIMYAYKSDKYSSKYDEKNFAAAAREEALNMSKAISKAVEERINGGV